LLGQRGTNGLATIYKTPHWNICIAQQQPIQTRINSASPDGNTVSASLVTPVVLLLNNTNIVIDTNRFFTS